MQTPDELGWMWSCGGCESAYVMRDCEVVRVGDGCAQCADGLTVGPIDEPYDQLVQNTLGWCTCGPVGEVDELMLNYLREPVIYGDDPLTLILAHVADRAGWVEHGTSINYSWLTDTGELVKARLAKKEDT